MAVNEPQICDQYKHTYRLEGSWSGHAVAYVVESAIWTGKGSGAGMYGCKVLVSNISYTWLYPKSKLHLASNSPASSMQE